MKWVWREFLIQALVACVVGGIVGGFASYVTAQVVLENHEVRIKSLEDDISDTKRNVDRLVESIGELKTLQTQLLANQTNVIRSITKLEATVTIKFEKYDDNMRQFYEKYGHILNPQGR